MKCFKPSHSAFNKYKNLLAKGFSKTEAEILSIQGLSHSHGRPAFYELLKANGMEAVLEIEPIESTEIELTTLTANEAKPTEGKESLEDFAAKLGTDNLVLAAYIQTLEKKVRYLDRRLERHMNPPESW
jgi:hypothetical protein